MTERREKRSRDWSPVIDEAIQRFRGRFWWNHASPPTGEAANTDQQLAVLFRWLDRASHHEQRFGNPAVVARPLALRYSLFDFWYLTWRHRGGKRNAHLETPGNKLLAYWAKLLAEGASQRSDEAARGGRSSGRLRSDEREYVSTKESAECVWFEERVHTWLKTFAVRFEFSYEPTVDGDRKQVHADAPLRLVVSIYRCWRGARKLVHAGDPDDPRVALPEVATARQLLASAELFAMAFAASDEDEFSHAHVDVGRESEARGAKQKRTEPDAPIVVTAKRAVRTRTRRVAAGLLAVVLPIGAGGYAWHRADVRTQLERAYHSFEIRVDVRERCEAGAALDVMWEIGEVPRPALFRNGRLLASLPPFSKGTYHDADVERGKSYAYAVGSRDLAFVPVGPPPVPYPGMFIPELCDQQKGPYMTFTPSDGTRETLFAIEARPPDVDGEPVGYSWNFYGTDFDEREQKFFMPWTPMSAKPRIVHRFVDEGANVENDVYRVPVTLRVEFKNGETKMYQGLVVVRGHRPAVLYRPWRWPWWKKLWAGLKERVVSSNAPPQL